jgi:hypothetical protein
LAPRTAPLLPWHEVHVDFIGPWKIKINKHQMLYNALTCIEPVTNLIEIVRLRGPKTAENTRIHFENNYLCRYPRHLRIVHDNGPEFMGHDFQIALAHAGINCKSIHISPNTPTANSVIESSHKAIGQVIRTLLHLKQPTSSAEADALIDEALATAMYVLRSTPNQSLGNYSPGALVFNRDMLLDIPLRADLVALTRHRQAQIDNRLLRVNAKRIAHEYKVDDLVYVKVHNRNKLDLVRVGPFPIIQIHTNNTVTIKRDRIHEQISIRHLLPCKHSSDVLVGANE